ncbi:MAG: DUF368 domain-containing protein [Odoribacter sp.]|nr:DUF368 domain-containing protein [Odoribacter sp.]
MRTAQNYVLLVLKGMGMGAADVVPGVSGGTIAFITGIYAELLNSIKSIDLTALKLLGQLRFKEFWRKINGSFLISVVGGIAISIFSLAKLMTYLLHNYPIATWAFFFGLIIASCFLVSKEVKAWNINTIIALLFGAAAAYTITVLNPAVTPHTWWFIILSGAIAVCAMVLPGISGAFILVLLGQYVFILGAVSELNIQVILLFIVGAIIGIISFSHLLSWLLKTYPNMTIALLTGFMIGSLNKVWPWKNVDGYAIAEGGEMLEIEKNVLPANFEGNPHVLEAIIMCFVGFFLIWGIEYAAGKLKKITCRRYHNLNLFKS